MYVVLDNTMPLSDNHDLVSGPFDSRADAIHHAHNLIDWYWKNSNTDSKKVVSDSMKIKGDLSKEYWIFLMNGEQELSRIRVVPVKNPNDYDLS